MPEHIDFVGNREHMPHGLGQQTAGDKARVIAVP